MHYGLQEKLAKFQIKQDGQPQCSSELSKNFEFWTNFEPEFLSSYGELAFPMNVLHKVTSQEDTVKVWDRLDQNWIFCELSTI